MGQYIEDLKGGKIMFDSKEEVELSKLSSDNLYVIKLTKNWLSAVTAVAFIITTAFTTYNIVDRRQTGHAIVTTTTAGVGGVKEK